MLEEIKNINTFANPVKKTNKNIFKYIKYLSAELEGAITIRQLLQIQSLQNDKIKCEYDISTKVTYPHEICNDDELLSISKIEGIENVWVEDYYPDIANCPNWELVKLLDNRLEDQEVQVNKTTSWEEFSKLTKQYYPERVNETCGGHIHIQFNDMRIHLAMATVEFSQFFENLCCEFAWTKIYNKFSGEDKLLYNARFQNDNCKNNLSEDIIKEQLRQTGGKENCRNYAINNCYNLCTHNTTEFRFFPILSNPKSYLNMIKWFLIKINDWIDEKKNEIFRNEWIFYDEKTFKGCLIKIFIEPKNYSFEINFYQNILLKDIKIKAPFAYFTITQLKTIKTFQNIFERFVKEEISSNYLKEFKNKYIYFI